VSYILNGFLQALKLIFSFDKEFVQIVFVSLKLSFLSTLFATLLGVPFGILVSYKEKFFFKNAIITVLNTCMSLPTVVIGLTVYSFLSRKGPFGEFALLFTQTAIVTGQIILIFPVISSLTISAIKGLDKRVKKTLISLGANNLQQFAVFLKEARFGITAAIIAGFGRVFAEVGISMMLGGNIKNYTRTITTAIALETSKGEFALGIALGIVLLSVALLINIIFSKIQRSNNEYL
jgi:tungstate transport system permease protein